MNTSEHLRSCCTDSTCCGEVDSSSSAVEDIHSEEISEDAATLRAAGFKLLLATGQPVTLDNLIAATDMAPERVAEIFESIRARGRVEFDNQGRLIGIAGLSLTPSRHRLSIGDTTRWAWCALDAVGILGALEATGSVRSADPQTGETIEIEFTRGTPHADAHLFILGGFSDGNVREDWCPLVNFFATRDAADAWVADNDLQGDIVVLSGIASEAADMWRPVVEHEAPQAS